MTTKSPKKLYRSRTDQKIAGVAGGLAHYFDLDPTLIRVLFVIALFLSFGFALFMYLALAFVMPLEPIEK